MSILQEEGKGATPINNDRAVSNMRDIYNFMGTFDVGECSTQYQFLFRRAKENMGTLIRMYQEWKKGSVFSQYTAEGMNAQRRAYMNALDKLGEMRSPY